MTAGWSEKLGWPVVDDGLLMVAIGDVMIVHTDDRMTDASFARHLQELARAIDRRHNTVRIGVLYDAIDGVDTSAKRRKESADVLAARSEMLAKTTAGFALVTTSAVMRGILRAVFWMAPPPYPWTIAASLREGLAFIREQRLDIDVDAVLLEYERFRTRHLPPRAATAGRNSS